MKPSGSEQTAVLDKMTRFIGLATSFSAAVAALGVLAIMVQVVLDAGLRTLINRPLPGTFEAVEFWWMPLIAFGGLALAEKQVEHIAAPVIIDRLPWRQKQYWVLIANSLTGLTVLLAAVYGWIAASRFRDMGEVRGATDLSVWPLRYWMVVGFVLYVAQVAIDTTEEFRSLASKAG